MKLRPIFLAIPVAAGALAVFLATRGNGDLAVCSRPVASTANWLPRSEEPNRGDPDYDWVNDNELITCQLASGQQRLVRLDVRRHTSTVLHRLADRDGVDLP
jgi:hypothetical protein